MNVVTSIYIMMYLRTCTVLKRAVVYSIELCPTQSPLPVFYSLVATRDSLPIDSHSLLLFDYQVKFMLSPCIAAYFSVSLYLGCNLF